MIGWFAIVCILAIYILAGSGLMSAAGSEFDFSILAQPYILKLLKFSFLQAALSVFLSIALAIPVARALHRQSFIGKQALLILSGLSLVIPVIVAILGIVTIHGNTGWLASLLYLSFGIKADYLYGLAGILIAHVFFNLPLAARVFYQSLDSLPNQNWRLAAQLGLSSWQTFRLLEWPLFKSQLPQLAGMIFLLCFTSFAVVLVLGGGPGSSTLEVAIYHAIRFDFNIAKAVILAGLQIFVCLFVFALLIRQSSQFVVQTLSMQSVSRFDGKARHVRFFDLCILLVYCAWIVLPIIAIFVSALNPSAWSVLAGAGLVNALKGSLLVAISSAALAMLLALSLAHLYKSINQPWLKLKTGVFDSLIKLILVFTPFVLATGLFVSFKSLAEQSGPVIVVLINALVVLPFITRIIIPSVLNTSRYDRLTHALGLAGWQRFKVIDWPLIARPVSIALGIALAMSLGDFSVIALFGSQNFQTLPLYLYRLMGSYQMDQAAVVAGLICVMCLLAFSLSYWLLGARHARS